MLESLKEAPIASLRRRSSALVSSASPTLAVFSMALYVPFADKLFRGLKLLVDPLFQTLIVEERQIRKVPKELTQAKSTFMYGKNTFRTNNGSKSSLNFKNNDDDDCMIVEKPRAHTKIQRVMLPLLSSKLIGKKEFLETLWGQNVYIWRLLIQSPLQATSRLTLMFVEIGFVTARAKLEMETRQRRGAVGSPSASVSPQCDNNSPSQFYNGRPYGTS